MIRKEDAMEQLFEKLSEIMPNACLEEVTNTLQPMEKLTSEQIINIAGYIASQVVYLRPNQDDHPQPGIPFGVHFLNYPVPKNMEEMKLQLRILPIIAKRLGRAFEENDLPWLKRSIDTIETISANTKFFFACQLWDAIDPVWDAIDPEECYEDEEIPESISNENKA